MNRTGILLTVVMIAVSAACAWAQSPAAGPNVNMVSGTDWTTGDPFLQRQNEPSIAVSTRNTSHLLAGANDYRSVDFEELFGDVNGEQTPDAWLGVFKSFDGGATWASTLLPGFPGDTSAAGRASPLSLPQLQAAADPIVRAGTNGMFYYAGIAFNRRSNTGKVFVARFIDNNNKENGDPTNLQTPGVFTSVSPTDPIRYLGTTVVQSGGSTQFLDKPWMAVDVPRGSATCKISYTNPDGTTGTQTIPAGNVYVTFSDFVNNNSQSSILFTKSTNCGSTWSAPKALSPIAVNQGSVIAIAPPIPGTENLLPPIIYVAWRRFGSGNTPGAIMMAESLDGGNTFTPAFAAHTFPVSCNTTPTGAGCPFDQGLTGTTFRTNAYPTMTADTTGRMYLAWSQRQANGDARIMLQVGLVGIPLPPPALVDNGPLLDDSGHPLTGLSGRGHQVMPSLTFNAGKLMMIYYDLREDHTIGQFTPLADKSGGYSETRFFEPELSSNDNADPSVFNFWIDDAGAPPQHPLTIRRHTIDLQGAQATPLAPLNLGIPAFSAFRISHYQFGINPANPYDTANVAQQLEVSPPNLPMFDTGTVPFMGDYIDVAGAPTFVLKNGTWHFNTDTSNGLPVFFPAWTDNRNVQPPPPGGSWASYTPPFSASNPGGGKSKFDPAKTVLTCNPGFTAMRNQDIYTSRVAPGLVVLTPGNQKTLGTVPNTATLLQRAFSVVVQNTTNILKTFRLTIANQPLLANGSVDPKGQATLQQLPLTNGASPLVTTLDVQVNPLSSISRSVFVKSQNATASVTVNVQEITGVGGTVVTGGLASTTVINPDPTAPAIINPDNPAVGNPAVSNAEVYNPAVGNPAVGNPAVGNPAVSNPAVSNPAVSNPAVGNPAVSNQALSAALNPAVGNPAVSNPAVGNPAVGNPAVSNQAVADVSYTLTNTGNTVATYSVQLFGTNPSSLLLQLILNKIYYLNIPGGADGCTLQMQPTNVILSNVPSPVLVTNPSNLGNPAVGNPAVSNATVAVPPGETVQITLRTSQGSPTQPPTSDQLNQLLSSVTPVVVAHATNTPSLGQPNPQPPISLTITTKTLPNDNTGVAYSQQLMAIGGVGTYIWSVYSGSLPSPLSLSSSGLIGGGTPTTAGAYSFVVQVADGASPAHIAQQALSITVIAPLAFNITPATQTATVGQFFSEDLSTFTNGGVQPYTYSVTSGSVAPFTFTGSTISGSPAASGSTGLFTVKVTDNAGTFTTSSQTINIVSPVTINSIQPSTTVGDGFGQIITLFTSGIPNSNNSAVTFTQGSNSQPGFVFMTGADVTYVRLPTSNPLSAGAATVTVTNTSTGVTSAPFNITVSTTPAAPVENFIYGLSIAPAPANLNCGGGLSASPVTAVTAGEGIVVFAYGTDTLGPTVVFSDGTHTIPVSPGCSAYSNSSLGIGSVVTVPAGLTPGPITVKIQTTVNSVTSALSNAINLTLSPPPAPAISTTTLPNGQYNFPYTPVVLSASSGTPPYTWSLGPGGVLPAGMTLDPNSGTISGTPGQAGVWSVPITVTDSNSLTGSANLLLTIGLTTAYDSTAGGCYMPYPTTPMYYQGNGASALWSVTAPGLLNGQMTFLSGSNVMTACLSDAGGAISSGIYQLQFTVTPSGGSPINFNMPLTVVGQDTQDNGTFNVNSGGVGFGHLPPSKYQQGVVTPGQSLQYAPSYAADNGSTTVNFLFGFNGLGPQACGSTSSTVFSDGVPLNAPAQPGRYDILFDGTTEACTPAAFPATPAPITTGSVDAVSSSTSFGGAVVTNVHLSSTDPSAVSAASNVLQIAAGANPSPVTVALHYTAASQDSCPGCIDQIPVGLNTDAGPQTCAYNGQPGVSPGVSGDANITINVPNTPGRYYVGIDFSEQFSCVSFWSNGLPNAPRYIGVVDVLPHTLVSMSVTPGSTLTLGQTQQFTATANYADGTSKDLTSVVTWSSSDPVRLPVDPSGLAHAYNEDDPAGPGTPVTISATLGSLTGSSLWHVTLLPSVGGVLQPYSCSLEGHVRSLSAIATSILFNNNNASSQTRQIFWLDYSGNRVLYNGTLAAGTSYLQGTFLTHPWVVADTSGTCQAIYVNPDLTQNTVNTN